MPQSFTGKIELDIRDSVPDWEPYLAPRAPKGSPFCRSIRRPLR